MVSVRGAGMFSTPRLTTGFARRFGCTGFDGGGV